MTKKKPVDIIKAIESISNISHLSAHHVQLFSMSWSSLDCEQQRKVIDGAEKNFRVINNLSHIIMDLLGLPDEPDMTQYNKKIAEKETAEILSRLNKK